MIGETLQEIDTTSIIGAQKRPQKLNNDEKIKVNLLKSIKSRKTKWLVCI